MANPIYGSENFATTLNVGGGINNSQTTGIVLTSVSGLDTSGGILGFDWASTLDTSTYEEIEYGGISGNELTGVIRGSGGTSAKSHANAAVIACVVSKLHINRLADKLRSVDAVLAQDTSANEIIKTTYVASAVNEVTVANAATGNGPSVSATGGDTNIDLNLLGKGTGRVKLWNGTSYVNPLVKRVTTITSSATPTINTDSCDVVDITALAAAITSMTTNLSGTPTNFQTLIIRIKDNGTARAITWGASFEARGIALPTTTVLSKVLTVGFIYDTTTSKWGCVASAQEA